MHESWEGACTGRYRLRFSAVSYFAEVLEPHKDGMLKPTTKKKWVSARDDRVCSYCEAIDDVAINMDDEFQGYKKSVPCPPMHPHCRCVLIYVEE